MEQKSRRDDRVITIFLVFWAVLFGSIARLLPALGGNMPVNDGGYSIQWSEIFRLRNFRCQPMLPSTKPGYRLHIRLLHYIWLHEVIDYTHCYKSCAGCLQLSAALQFWHFLF